MSERGITIEDLLCLKFVADPQMSPDGNRVAFTVKEVVFVRYPQETNHGLSRSGPPDLRIDRLHRIADWLDTHLKERGHGTSTDTG